MCQEARRLDANQPRPGRRGAGPRGPDEARLKGSMAENDVAEGVVAEGAWAKGGGAD